jgi:integrase
MTVFTPRQEKPMPTKKKDTRSRGQIERRGDYKFLVRVFIGRVDGKRRYASKVVEGTFKQAEKELTKMLGEVDTQSFVEPSKLTVKEYMLQWLDGRLDIKPRTKRGYREQIEYNIVPKLGHYRVDQLNKLVIEKAWRQLLDEGKAPGNITLAHRVLSPALGALVAEQKLVRNPCDLVNLPRNPKKEKKILSPDQVRTFLTANQDHELYGLWLLNMVTGLRPSEALGLRWADIDLDTGTISVQRSVTEDEKGALMVDETKTALSARMISIPSTCIEALRAHRRRQAAEMLRAGKSYAREHLWVFANHVGHLWDLTAVRKRFKVCLKRAGLPEDITFYAATRHTHATMLLVAKVNPKVVSERLGHSSIKLTMDTYTHVIPEISRETAETVETLLFREA